MGFLKNKILGKKNPPEELPDLAIDEIKSKITEQDKEIKKTENQEKQTEILKKQELKEINKEVKKDAQDSFSEDKKIIELIPEHAEEADYESHEKHKKQIEKEKLKIQAEKSFFAEMLKDMEQGIENDSEDFEKWYKNKFLSKKIVDDMKEYWENQKQELASDIFSKKIKDKIKSKIEILKTLESEWQNNYVNLIHKEEEIKKEEKELKKLLSEFIEKVKSGKKQKDFSEENKTYQENKKIPENKRFFTKEEAFSDLNELAEALQKNENLFYEHSGEGYDNFADWIENVLEFKELAEKLRKTKDKEGYIELLLSERR